MLSCLTGALTGCVIFIFRIAIRYTLLLSEHVYSTARENPVMILPLLTCAIAIGAVAYVIIRLLPIVRGSGIPNSLAILRGFIPFKWISSLLGIFTSTLLSFLVGDRTSVV